MAANNQNQLSSTHIHIAQFKTNYGVQFYGDDQSPRWLEKANSWWASQGLSGMVAK